MPGSTGGIIKRGDKIAGPKPALQLPFAMRGAEPLFTWLMDTAAETKDIQLDLKEIAIELRDLGREIRDLLQVIASKGEPDEPEESSAGKGTDRTASGPSQADAVESGDGSTPPNSDPKAEDDPASSPKFPGVP